ncbi:MAG: hypothetical protein P1U77_06085 [Rubripirellula sp.]|jgi:hypothetical protein|nr:hypothetical protein [Rubripirellula sp.]
MTENTEEPLDQGSSPSATNSSPSTTGSEAADVAAEDAVVADALTTDIRVGSPFAVDPTIPAAERPIEPFYDVGPIRYTAMGAVAAAIMVLGFASVAAWWFPSGGALIAALGCVLSVFGLYSAFRKTAISLLAIHLALFVLSYSRSIV